MTKLWLDDERPAPEGWVWVKTALDAMEAIAAGGVEEVDLDHDLGDLRPSHTGYAVLLYIEAMAAQGASVPHIEIHTRNSSARVKMELAKEAIERMASRSKRAGGAA